MTTAALAGYAGVVSGPSGIGEITNWTLNIEIAALDATSMDSAGWREYIAGLQGVTGSFRSIKSKLTMNGTAVSLTLQTATASGVSISGSAFLIKETPSVPVDGVVSWDFDFVFTGSVTIAAT